MRHILIDYARARKTDKRGGGIDVLQLEEELVFEKGRSSELLALDDALDRLEQECPRAHQIVELRFFAGLSIKESAEVTGLSARTVKREWSFGRAWLRTELAGEVS